MGCNANPCQSRTRQRRNCSILADQMGFLVMDEIFDVWYRSRTPYDFHLIFALLPAGLAAKTFARTCVAIAIALRIFMECGQ